MSTIAIPPGDNIEAKGEGSCHFGYEAVSRRGGLSSHELENQLRVIVTGKRKNIG